MKPREVVALRNALEMTQEEFAREIGAGRVTVARWENGTHEPRGLYLAALVKLQARVRKTGRARIAN